MVLRWASLPCEGLRVRRKCDWASNRVPDPIIRQALSHTDSNVREFGINSVGRRAHEVVTNPTIPMPYGRDIVEATATGDPVPGLRRQAADLVTYMGSFLPKK